MSQMCRVVKPQIPARDYHGRREVGFVQTVPAFDCKSSMEAMVGAVLPGHTIEHLGRGTIALRRSGPTFQATSLFFQAVHQCFEAHHPLVLRPEVLMHLIVHEVATTVNRYTDEFRHLFTGSAQKERIDVRHDGLVHRDPNSPWDEAIRSFEPELQKVVPAGIMEHMLPGFSTETPITRAASLVAFMDAAQKFYDYHTHTMCGIPEIRLLGTPEDYRRIMVAAQQLSERFESRLGTYFHHLLPVLHTLYQQANGAPVDEHFWSSIYKFKSSSGTDRFNGWLSAFVNYVQQPEIAGGRYQKAQTGGLVEKSENAYEWDQIAEKAFGMPGIDLGSVPSHISTAPFTWHYLGVREFPMLFVGGVLNVEVVDGALMPGLSYAVLHQNNA